MHETRQVVSVLGELVETSAPHHQSRSRRERGPFIAVVGPDGVGKTSVCRALADLYGGETAYLHFRPPTSGRLPTGPPEFSVPPPDKGPDSGSRVAGWLRLARNVVRFWIGYLATIRPALQRGALVVADRWAYGYVAQPRALKYFGPEALARLAIRLLPRPDLVANLTAPPEVIHERKQELTLDEISAELETWATIPARRLTPIDTTDAPPVVARRILEALGP